MGIIFAYNLLMALDRAKILLLDDDPAALRFLEYKLKRSLPEVDCESRLEPEVEGDFDIYFIDNEFEGQRIAAQLADRIRSLKPSALIIAYSATLDRETLKRLMKAGCTKACDKSEPNELEATLDTLRRHVESMKVIQAQQPPRGPLGSIIHGLRTLTGLFESWNTRLRQNETQLRLTSDTAQQDLEDSDQPSIRRSA